MTIADLPCQDPDCPGTVGADGYCQRCGLEYQPALAVANVPDDL